MVCSMLRKFLPLVVCCMVVLSGATALAQALVTAPAPAAAGEGQIDQSVLPDRPSAFSSSVPSQGQAHETLQREAVSAQSANLDGRASKMPVTILEDTLIRVMTDAPMNSKEVRPGMPVLCTVSEDVKVGNILAIPRGATVRGTVIRSKKAGVLTGSPELILELVSLDLGGRNYPLYTYQFEVKGTSKTRPTEVKARDGAVVGTLVGGVFSGSAKGGVTDMGKVVGMTTGAAVGAGVGTMVSAATPGPGISIPAESEVDFYLASPITVPLVDPKDAARLAQRLHGGPALYVRDDADR
jgi:hypothetical protein